MIFNSLTYLALLALVVPAYWWLPRTPRLLLLVAASFAFYGFWRFDFAVLLLISALVDYVVARRLPQARAKRALVAVSLVVNLGLLLFFKYGLFISENAVGLASLAGITLDPIITTLILPIGISFYTFQTISYTIDVYREQITPERDFAAYLTYVVFFPQLIAGPILRAKEILPQLHTRPPWAPEFLTEGLRRILYGLFLKVFLADQIAPHVNTGFATDPALLSAIDVWTLAFLFGFQIYFDFSAYSHIALGSARLMGIRFPENFAFPYLADSPRAFWRRWHISLSSWIRDYLYLPLAGARVQSRSTGGLDPGTAAMALFLTWFVMGLWHGANWTFAIWGLYHASVIFAHRLLARALPLPDTRGGWVLGVALTLPVIMLGWVPFRAESVAHTLDLWGRVLNPAAYTHLGLRENAYLAAAAMTALMLAAFAARRFLFPAPAAARPWPARLGEGVMVAGTFALVLAFLRPVEQFIYFQF